jgi:membrane associated rhomboid family serine protease
MGALARSYIQQGQYWRFLTAPFLNPDILSFAMSQFYLMVLGGNIELYVTAKGIGLGYFLGGIEGGLMAYTNID